MLQDPNREFKPEVQIAFTRNVATVCTDHQHHS